MDESAAPGGVSTSGGEAPADHADGDRPSLSLPKAGGDIRGMGEKFATNPVTGTASLQVPVAVTPCRGGAAPHLSLSYDSGAGNGLFGLGWSIAVPSVSRRTDKGIPRYADSDVFQLTDAEDLVPAELPAPRVDGMFDVQAYRPRTEGGFARIERWQDRGTGETHWRVTSRDNVTSVFGRDPAARVADPSDATKVFRWLLEETADDRGNVVSYEYKAEDRAGVDVTAPYEANRMAVANRHVKRIRYGNVTPGSGDAFLFEIVFDYGEHDNGPDEVRPWPLRADPFGGRRAGFEIRTQRLCRRILMFHHIDESVLVSATELTYAPDPVSTKLTAVTHRGYVGADNLALPTMTFDYTQRVVSGQWLPLSADVGQAPRLDGGYRWVDLDGEGAAGILAEQGGAWHYRANLGDGAIAAPALVDPLPVGGGLSRGKQLLDLVGDGRLSLTDLAGTVPGYHRRTPDGGWADFRPFDQLPTLAWRTDPNLRFVDLTGDGLADVLLTADDGLTWYPSAGPDGYGDAVRVAAARTEEHGPLLVFADAEQSVFLADMTGDGLTDLVRIRNGEVAYWPSLGYGRFGPKVAMAGAPVFDRPDVFDRARVRLSDVDGSGPADLLYAAADGVRVWFNQAGNSWSEPEVVQRAGVVGAVSVTDLLGHGTACLVVAEPRADQEPQVRYVDLMAAGKPHLLSSVDNGMGMTTMLRYESSTAMYLADKAAGRPWSTTLPFPVQVIAEVTARDSVADTVLVSTYRYRHGFYDGVEREFRGFGYVEQRDAFADSADDLDQPPALTKRWQHTGQAALDFSAEYWQKTALLPATALPAGLTTGEEREAARALRGHTLREEIYAEDGTELRDRPYTVTESNYQLRLVQPQESRPYAVVLASPNETLTVHSERQIDDPRLTHAVTLEIDDWGNVLRTAQIAYPRKSPLDDDQARLRIATSEHVVVNDVDGADRWRLGVPIRSRDHEVAGIAPKPGEVFTRADLLTGLAALQEIPYQQDLSGASPQRRLIADAVLTYSSDDLSAELPVGQIGVRALPWSGYRQAFADGHVAALFGDKVTDDMLREAGYVQRAGETGWWTQAGRKLFDAQHFYLAGGYLDAFGAQWRVDYDPHFLAPVAVADPFDNTVRAQYNYRVMQPWLITDPNGNRSGVRFDALGMVVATAVMGKEGSTDGDSLDLSTVESSVSDDPTTYLKYDLTVRPVLYRAFAREQHRAAETRWQESRTYGDGSGRTILTKVQAEPVNGTPRWVGTGRTIHNNKGNPVKKYEPYFATDGGFDTEAVLVRQGVTAILRYDPVNRLVRTDYPDGSYATVVFSAWEQDDWDRNDTVLDSRWLQDRNTLPATDPRNRAAALTRAHAGTCTRTRFDTLGRAHAITADNGAGQLFTTTVDRDIQGHERVTTDARGVEVLREQFDMLGRGAHSLSVDAGERWLLADLDGKPVRTWDGRAAAGRSSYDLLRRPTHAFATPAGKAELLRSRYYYGEQLVDGAAHNLLTRPCAIYDGAGVVRTVDVDFKGNTLTSTRQLTVDARTEADWSPLAAIARADDASAAAAAMLEATDYSSRSGYDALNRPVLLSSPDGSVTRPAYNEANLLERLDVQLAGAATWTPFVTNIDYNARGQRVLLELGSGVRTVFTYEPDTFRLSTLDSRGPDGGALQSLSYTYDPAGNIVETDDAAQQTLFFANSVVTPNKLYTYDPTYRLGTAEGREHIGQTTASQPGPYDDPPFDLPHGNDAQAMRRYTETFTYDEVGNIVSVAHAAGTGSWTRRHDNAPDSNRLVASSLPGDATGTFSARYTYDANGNLLATPQLSALTWDVENRLVEVDLGGGGTAYYQYNASGQRVRATVVNNGTAETRIYLGATELYRKVVAGSLRTERQTLHVGGADRVALVETTTTDADPTPVLRYQLGDHLGSAVVEVDEKCALLSYEEYHPYGTTSFRSATGAAEVSMKRYRFTGKEKDAETGLYYHGARYYAPWLARWTAADPIGIKAGTNMYGYCRGNPVTRTDPTGTQDNDKPSSATGLIIAGKGISFGTFATSSRDSSQYVVGFGVADRDYMGQARSNTGLRAINIQDQYNRDEMLFSKQPNQLAVPFFPAGWAMGDHFAIPDAPDGARNLYPMFSGVMAQDALEGKAGGTVHFDIRTADGKDMNFTLSIPKMPAGIPDEDKDRFLPGFAPEDTHSASELRQGVAHVAATDPGERKVDIVFQHEAGVTTIPRDSNEAQGAPLPNSLANRMPNIKNATGSGSGGSAGGSLSGAAQSGSGAMGRTVAGVAEAEAGLVGLAQLAATTSRFARFVTPLLTTAQALPVAVGAGATGAMIGSATRSVATAAGASDETATTLGLGAAMLTGAALGSVIPGVGTAVGAAIGAFLAGAMYLMSL